MYDKLLQYPNCYVCWPEYRQTQNKHATFPAFADKYLNRRSKGHARHGLFFVRYYWIEVSSRRSSMERLWCSTPRSDSKCFRICFPCLRALYLDTNRIALIEVTLPLVVTQELAFIPVPARMPVITVSVPWLLGPMRARCPSF